jgi:hypothetical protein
MRPDTMPDPAKLKQAVCEMQAECEMQTFAQEWLAGLPRAYRTRH